MSRRDPPGALTRALADLDAPPPSRLAAVLIDLLLWPGAGHLVLGRRVTGWAWIAATLAAVVLGLWWPIALLASLAARLLAALDAGLGPVAPGRATTVAVAVVVGLAVICLVGLPLKLWLLELFRIPSGGMAPTLVPGDYLVVNKLAPRLGPPARGDVVAFRSPCAPHPTFVKRVVGLPGDTVEIRCGVLYLDGTAVPTHLEVRHETWWDQDETGRAHKEQASRYSETLDGVSHSIYAADDRPARDQIRHDHPDRPRAEMAAAHDFPGPDPPDCSRFGEPAGSSKPAAGQTPRGTVEGGAPPATGCAPFRHYVVPAGAVFVLGDNRDDSADSRVFGAVPLANLVGRATGIWFSTPPAVKTVVRWRRLGRIR